jgi:hypothetical protein
MTGKRLAEMTVAEMNELPLVEFLSRIVDCREGLVRSAEYAPPPAPAPSSTAPLTCAHEVTVNLDLQGDRFRWCEACGSLGAWLGRGQGLHWRRPRGAR